MATSDVKQDTTQQVGAAQPAQETSIPTYITNAHKVWVAHMEDLVADQFSGEYSLSPYSNAHSYDPTDVVSKIALRMEDYENHLEELNNTFGLDGDNGFLSMAADQMPLLLEADDLATVLGDWVTKQEGVLAQNAARLSSGFNDIGAINSSAYWIAQALLEAEFNTQTGLMRQQLARERDDMRSKLMMSLTELNINSTLKQLEFLRSLVEASMEYAKISITAEREFLSTELQIAVEDRKWDLDFLRDAGGILSMTASIAGTKPAPSPAGSFLSGMMSAIGAVAPLAQAAGPGLGTALTVAAGFIGGGASLLNANRYQQA